MGVGGQNEKETDAEIDSSILSMVNQMTSSIDGEYLTW